MIRVTPGPLLLLCCCAAVCCLLSAFATCNPASYHTCTCLLLLPPLCATFVSKMAHILQAVEGESHIIPQRNLAQEETNGLGRQEQPERATKTKTCVLFFPINSNSSHSHTFRSLEIHCSYFCCSLRRVWASLQQDCTSQIRSRLSVVVRGMLACGGSTAVCC